jgi:hypothetical protein
VSAVDRVLSAEGSTSMSTDNKLPIGQVSHTLQAEMLVAHQAQKPCTTLLEQIG